VKCLCSKSKELQQQLAKMSFETKLQAG
jgi:hypothetical protein